MKKVIAIDRAFPSYGALEKRLNELDAELVFAEDKSEEALAGLCAGAAAVMTTYTPVSARILEAMGPGSMVIRTGIGVDNIDLEAARRQGVQVSFVPDYCREEVADHTVALLLCAVRKIQLCTRHAKEDWDMKKQMGFVPRLSTCVAGILSLGAIGKMIASRLQAFGVEVWGYDPYLPENVFSSLGVRRCASQDEIFTGADFIILTGPLTPERYHTINADAIARMKKTAFVVNTARGALVDEKALADALRSSRIAGAGLDVFENEPITDPSLYDLDNLVITPHVAFYSAAAFPDLEGKVYDEVVRAVKGEPLRTHV